MIRHPLGRSFLSFAKRYCAAYHNGFGWVTDGASNLEELAIELGGALLRRVKEDVLDDYVSVEAARERYGVVLRGSPEKGDLEVDMAATAALRQELGAGGADEAGS